MKLFFTEFFLSAFAVVYLNSLTVHWLQIPAIFCGRYYCWIHGDIHWASKFLSQDTLQLPPNHHHLQELPPEKVISTKIRYVILVDVYYPFSHESMGSVEMTPKWKETNIGDTPIFHWAMIMGGRVSETSTSTFVTSWHLCSFLMIDAPGTLIATPWGASFYQKHKRSENDLGGLAHFSQSWHIGEKNPQMKVLLLHFSTTCISHIS